jgi:hypothetical protein
MQHIDAESLASGENLTHQEKTHRFAELYAEIVEAYERRQ